MVFVENTTGMCYNVYYIIPNNMEICVKHKRTRYYTPEDVELHNCEFKTDNKKFKDLTGQVFGQFEVLKMKERSAPHTRWFCKCGCGNIQAKSTNQLNRGSTSCTECSFIKAGKDREKPLEDEILIVNSKHPNLELISRTKSKKEQWLWYCSECNTPYKHRLDHVTSDRKTCRCNPHKFQRWTKQLREFQIREACVERGLKFLGWLGEYENKNTTRMVIKCKNHKHYDVAINNFMNGHGCPHCAEEKRGDGLRHHASRIEVEGRKIFGNKFDYSKYDYICSRTPSTIYCNDCKGTFESSYDNHINKRKGCPHEVGRTQRQAYIFEVSDNGIPIALKVGIANFWDRRLKEQSAATVFDVQVLGVWEFDEVSYCKSAESFIKKNLDRKVLSKSEYPDGFDETFSLADLDNIFKIIEDFNGVRCK
ncbi:hypothetical protein TUST1-159_00640 [Vibrio phage ICP1_2006_B]|nr:hypothetical protein TUST1-159_00640 [Vibrio phage ICP1_2006_B]